MAVDVGKSVAEIKARSRRRIYDTTLGPFLFRARYFCFCTVTTERSPTFYFATRGYRQGGGISGRLRTMHQDGPLIEVTRQNRKHLFCSSEEQLKNLQKFEVGWASKKDAFRDLEKVRRGERYKTYDDIDYFDGDNAVRSQPQDRDFHYEYLGGGGPDGDELTYDHPSQGRVQLMPKPTDQQINKIVARLLDEEAAVKSEEKTVATLGTEWRKHEDFVCYDLSLYLQTL